MQTDLNVSNGKITGTLKYIDDGSIAEYWGAGNFMALKFSSDDWDNYDSIKVGMDPSQGSGLVEISKDPDKNGVFKVTATTQKFKVVGEKDGEKKTVTYDLSELTLLDE